MLISLFVSNQTNSMLASYKLKDPCCNTEVYEAFVSNQNNHNREGTTVQVQSPNSTIPNSGKTNINQSGIGNRKPIGQEPKKPSDTYLVVDMLLEDYKDLIDPAYSKWFAKRFYTLPFDQIHAAAQEARQAKDPMRLFSFIVNKKYNAMTIKRRYADLKATV